MMDVTPTIACVVEGEGDELALPILVRRIAAEITPPIYPHVLKPLRVPRGRIIMTGGLERYIELAARQVGDGGAILVMIDSDDDCPATLGPNLLTRAVAQRRDVPISVVLAHREFESWFLAAAESLQGKRQLPDDLTSPVDVDSIRGAKGWIERQMASRRYRELEDQPALAHLFDLSLARSRSDSFDKCYRDVVRILTTSR
jgi:hypothetical protein